MRIPKWMWLVGIAILIFWGWKAMADGPGMTSAVMSDPGMGGKTAM